MLTGSLPAACHTGPHRRRLNALNMAGRRSGLTLVFLYQET